MFKRFLRTFPKQCILLGAFISYKGIQSQDLNVKQIEPQIADLSLKQQINEQKGKNLIKIELCDAKIIEENEIYDFNINGYNVVVTRVEGKLNCVSGTCTYDDKTLLKDGQLFKNKLYCPQHGCAFNSESGSVEYAPAIDNLPKFFIKESEGKAVLYFPKNPPIKIMPELEQRDYNDMRKVVIVGSNHKQIIDGVAAFQTILTLRSHGYTGELTLISKDTKLPYDKSQLTRQIKDASYQNLLFKQDDWYDQLEIDYQLGQEVTQVVNDHGAPHLFLQDGTRLEYDGLLFCTGENEMIRNIHGIAQKQNILFLKSIQEMEKLQKILKDEERKVSIIGLSLQSLETAATLKKEYPNIKINLIDENKKTQLQTQLGQEVSQHLIEMHQKQGVQFHFHNEIREFISQDNLVNKIELNTGEQLETDVILCFPNNKMGNSDYLDQCEKLENIEIDGNERVKVDSFQRSEHKRVFFAGKCCAMNYFGLNQERISCQNHQQEMHQGLTAAYNILGLAIPYCMVPVSYMKQYNKTFWHLGVVPQFDDIHIEGSLENNDFIAYYGYNNHLLGVFGTRQQEILTLNEALRLQETPSLEQIKNGEYNQELMRNHLISLNRSGCYKDLIHKVRYDPVEVDVLWVNREPKSQFWDSFNEDQRPSLYSEELNNNQ